MGRAGPLGGRGYRRYLGYLAYFDLLLVVVGTLLVIYGILKMGSPFDPSPLFCICLRSSF
jgi:hypothetical protein